MTFKPMALSEIAAHLGGTVEGDAGVLIRRVAPLDQAGAGDLSFLANPRYARLLATTRASAVLVDAKTGSGPGSGGVPAGVARVRVAQPYLAYARAVTLLWQPARPEPGVHAGATVHPAARVDPSAAVLPLAYVGADSTIGPRTVLHPGAIVLERCRIGADCVLYPGVVVREDCVLGARVILHNQVSIGADGYGFAQQAGPSGSGAASSPAGGVRHVKIPQVGNVVLEDDVEIGACSCVDRAALGSTRIGRGTKIDDLVMIGHGCQIGADCLIVAQSGLAGSAVLEERVVLGARAGVLGHLTVGAGATLMSRSHVTRPVPAGAVVSGNPARPHREQLRQDALLARLGALVERVEKLERAAKAKPRATAKGRAVKPTARKARAAHPKHARRKRG